MFYFYFLFFLILKFFFGHLYHDHYHDHHWYFHYFDASKPATPLLDTLIATEMTVAAGARDVSRLEPRRLNDGPGLYQS